MSGKEKAQVHALPAVDIHSKIYIKKSCFSLYLLFARQKAWWVMGRVYCGGVSRSIEADWTGVITI